MGGNLKVLAAQLSKYSTDVTKVLEMSCHCKKEAIGHVPICLPTSRSATKTDMR